MSNESKPIATPEAIMAIIKQQYGDALNAKAEAKLNKEDVDYLNGPDVVLGALLWRLTNELDHQPLKCFTREEYVQDLRDTFETVHIQIRKQYIANYQTLLDQAQQKLKTTVDSTGRTGLHASILFLEDLINAVNESLNYRPTNHHDNSPLH